MIKKINAYFINCNRFLLIGIFVTFNLFISVILNILSKLLYQKSFTENTHAFSGFFEELILVVIVCPIIETVLFQFLVIEILNEKLKKEIICIISALIFASTHMYNFIYFSFAIIIGLNFAYLYYLGRPSNKGFFIVFVTHLIYNAIVFCLKHLS